MKQILFNRIILLKQLIIAPYDGTLNEYKLG